MIRFLFAVLTLTSLTLTGCLGLGYQVGSKSLFGQDIKTVYVPIFEADPTRRDLAERLTEAVCKRIEERSPYKVIGRPSADSVLEGRIVQHQQGVALVDDFNDPRQKSRTISIEIKWKDRRSNDLRQFDLLSWNEGSGQATASAYMIAEFGQSQLTQEQQQIDKLADQIVGMMETPW
jgi:hypothetical protein